MIKFILGGAALMAFLSFASLLLGNPNVMTREEIKCWCLILLMSCAVLVPWVLK